MLTVTILAIFVSVSLLTVATLYPVLTRRSIVKDRLAKLTDEKSEQISLVTEKTDFQKFLDRLGGKMPGRRADQSKYTKFLLEAGYRKESIYLFHGTKILLASIFPALFVILYALPKGVLLQGDSLLYTVILAIVGYLLPTFFVGKMAERRKLTIFHTLPDILDLVTVCVEAGLSIDSAMMRVSENPQFTGNPLAKELRTVTLETRAGKPRPESLRDMAARTGVEDVSAFVTMLIQTEKFGTSLSQALRVHSESLRTKRRQIAEEAAAKTTIKMLFPLAFCIFPALLVILLGPATFMFRTIFK